MEVLPANSEVALQVRTSQLTTTTAAAWHVLGLLLSHGRPARLSELVSSFKFFHPTPDFIRLLCSIPDSPLRFTENHFVTLSQIGLAAVAQFFANSDVWRHLDFPKVMPRLYGNDRSNCIVRTYCRKRKRATSEIEDFTLKRKSYFQDFDEEKILNEMVMAMPGGFWSVYNQGIETLSGLSPLLAYDCRRLEKIMFKPAMFAERSSGQLGYKVENTGDGYSEMGVIVLNKEELGYLHQKRFKSNSLSRGRFPHIEKQLVAEDPMHSVPHPDLLLHPCMMGNSEGSRIENDTVDQVCESLPEDLNWKKKEVSIHESGRSRGHKENQQMYTTYTDRFHIDNPEKTLDKANNVELFHVIPRTDDHLQSQGEVLNHLVKYSFMPKPDQKDEPNNREKTLCLTMESSKRLPDGGTEQFKADKNSNLDKQKTKCNCDQYINTKEKRATSTENRKRASSISNNHIEKKPFPDFESFIVDEEEGSGGYGTVYRARRKADGVTFAIKCPHVNANRNYVHNELKMLERLGGKNFVIKYEGSFRCGRSDCLVLEHVEHDRPEILKREINIIQLQWYGYCLFKALAGLHKQDIVHRDVKPGNFLYSRKANKGYLIDFNLALDMRKKYGTIDNSKAGHSLNFDQVPTALTKYLPSAKSRKLSNTRFPEAVDKTAGKISKSLLPPGNLKKKVDKAKVLTDTGSRNIIKSQGADGSGITSAKDATSTRTPSAERLREPLPSQGRKELISLVQEALQGGNHVSVNAPTSKRKRVAANPGNTDNKFLYPTPMPLHANGVAIGGAGLVKSKGDGKHRREGPCVGTKGFKAPEVLFRSLHQGPKADIWSAGVTLLYLMIGRAPFIGDTDQNIKEIATLRGSEDLWEVAKLHNHESLFPTELLDVKYLSPVKLRDWCARNTRRPDFVKAIPASLFDLVDKCLMVNPRQRISAEEALRHEFFAPCHEALRKHRPERGGMSKESGSTS
ncbi:Cell division cycle 7-related protein kinase [Sesamum alatum]|uniref:non-specific serine/threonine protein kinase n=1 Tax=Sesamum alatum TaxID=300844 RepID=A0AAE2CI46_9LAMI|nr:Cell division cycle 7-related protein kinase [Sesamum alatum]